MNEGQTFWRCGQQLEHRIRLEPDARLRLIVERALQGTDVEVHTHGSHYRHAARRVAMEGAAVSVAGCWKNATVIDVEGDYALQMENPAGLAEALVGWTGGFRGSRHEAAPR